MNHEIFKREDIEVAKRYAIHQFPKEMCGFLTNRGFVPAENVAENPSMDFKIDPAFYLKIKQTHIIFAILHSHVNGRTYPSQLDMESQVRTDVPWGIILTDGSAADDPVMWGDSLPIAPLIGRRFMHGVWDCYSLVRDTFRLGRQQLEEQGITKRWPFEAHILPEYPRSDAWWEGDDDLYTNNFRNAGFEIIDREDARIGDCFLMSVGSNKKLSHAAIYIDQDLILHHLPTRLSRREPAGIWARHANLWLRFTKHDP